MEKAFGLFVIKINVYTAYMTKRCFLLLLVCLCAGTAWAQQVAFGVAEPLLPGASSDQGVGMVCYKDRCYVTWKEPGAQGQLRMAMAVDTQSVFEAVPLAAIRSIAGPALVAADAGVYLFWLAADSTLQYTLLRPGANWQQAIANSLPGEAKDMRCVSGVSAVVAGDKILLGTRAAYKDRLNLVVCSTAPDGTLSQTSVTAVRGARSLVHPVLCNTGKTVRCWWGRSGQLTSLDYDAGRDSWSKTKGQAAVASNYTPVLAAGSDRLLYIWSSKEQRQLQYYLSGDGLLWENEATALPHLETGRPLGLAATGQQHFLLVYAGADRQLYRSRGRVYRSASWMEDLLMPGREKYTLRDIALPGSHDAGMSVLTAVGGKSTYTINECNTLTQLLPVSAQLDAGIRMFELRIDLFEDALYTKHAPSDCMEDAVGGGYGEPLDTVLTAVKRFLDRHQQEFVILSFCHFCDRHKSIADQAAAIVAVLGPDKVYHPGATHSLADVSLQDLAGKVLLSFEEQDFPLLGVVRNTMTERSSFFFNYRRAYAATNITDSLFAVEQRFFKGMKGKTAPNDIIRLDWQLTQIGQEAALSCGQFQSENGNLLLDATLLIANTIKKNKSIISLAQRANRYLPAKVLDWVAEGVIDRETKPNILYVDVAGNWITDFCILLNSMPVYKK